MENSGGDAAPAAPVAGGCRNSIGDKAFIGTAGGLYILVLEVCDLAMTRYMEQTSV